VRGLSTARSAPISTAGRRLPLSDQELVDIQVAEMTARAMHSFPSGLNPCE
jgi:hypothetical protein